MGRGMDRGMGCRRLDGRRIRATKSQWNIMLSALTEMAIAGKIALTVDQLNDCRDELEQMGYGDLFENGVVGGKNITFLDWDWCSIGANPYFNASVIDIIGPPPLNTIYVVKSRNRGRPKGEIKRKILAAIRVSELASSELLDEVPN